MISRRILISTAPAAIAAAALAGRVARAADTATSETGQIAEEAFVYGFPMVMAYGILYEYFVDKSSSQYKTSFNQIYNTARVYTPEDTAVVTPNSEVAEHLWVEWVSLVHPESYRPHLIALRGTVREFPAYHVSPIPVWGMTERILAPLVELLAAD